MSYTEFLLNADESVCALLTIGYGPMIKGSYTEFTTVYTVMRHAQILSYALEQDDAVIASEIAIFFKAKEIQLKFFEESSNTLIRLGGLHSALNYMCLLGKKFRFYVWALGNISVFGFMIFITLSVFNDI